MPESVTVKQTLTYDALGKEIGNMWLRWNSSRNAWLVQRKELREYLFATDTRGTTNAKLPWKNSTVTPKLTQIRDNLHANYLAALFPQENWFIWEGQDQDALSKEKRQTIESYMRTKLKASGFELLVSQLILDYIDNGNVIAGHEFISDIIKDVEGNPMVKYIGPRAFRVSPLDIVFDPTASSFDTSPMIHRVLKSFGDLVKDMEDKPNLNYNMEKVEYARKVRTNIRDYSDDLKQAGFTVDGFATLEDYYQSNNVELLHFYGDIYNMQTGTLMKNQIVTVLDRCHIIRQVTNPSWLGTKPYKHCGWRLRPDNLWAQGPLDQLVGMQYRVDHLENLKADVFDQIAHPVTKVTGTTVEDFVFAPGVTIQCGDEGDVEFMRPEAQALNADMQIDILMQRMEEMAGAPKQAAGIRTPGEKTKYEVQVLENGAGRIFQNKVTWFEKNIIEPILNSMLEEARRNLTGKESVGITDPDTGAVRFMDITKEDITAKGKLFPVGARHFAEQARMVQDLTTTLQIVEKLPTVKPHVSGIAVAKALEHALGWESFKIVQKNIAVAEGAETQKLIGSAQEQIDQHAMTPTELQPGDLQPGDIPNEPNPAQKQA